MLALRFMTVSLFLAFLCGCAAGTQSSAAAEATDLDCSFRSPTTCWTVSGRFPAVRSKVTAPPERAPRQPPPVLASGADSAQSPR
jgi:hypothetical protein